jgi:hypothetical protein
VLVASLCLNPVEHVATDQVDLVEWNHLYDEQGHHVFDQIIFYDWSPRHGRYQVRAWRLLKKPNQVPYWDRTTQRYLTLWHDGCVLRKVQAKTMRQSWTQHDPELIERAFLPKDQRSELRKLILHQPAAD